MTGIHPITRQRARKLRAEMTPQERRVWAKLRELNQVLGLHFRRQAPIGPFIADFADLGRRVVIEIDGGGHSGERDAKRDEWMAGQGFQILRFWNPEVSENLEGVMQLVLDAIGPLDEAPPPRPFPTREEGGAWFSDAAPVGRGVPPIPVPSPQGGGGPLGVCVAPHGLMGTPPASAPPPHPSPTRGEGGAALDALRGTADPKASPPPCGEGMGVGGLPPDTRAPRGPK